MIDKYKFTFKKKPDRVFCTYYNNLVRFLEDSSNLGALKAIKKENDFDYFIINKSEIFMIEPMELTANEKRYYEKWKL